MTIFKDDVEMAQKRIEAWWGGAVLDRAAVLVTAPRTGGQTYAGPDSDDLMRYWTDPDIVIPRLFDQLENTFFGAEALPVMFPVSIRMVSILNKYLGAPNTFVDRHTTWSEPIIADWETRPTFRFDPDNSWWRLSQDLLKAAVLHARENDLRYFVGVPDLNGPTEVLSGLRGAQQFALDLIDNPGYIKPALTEVNQAWRRYWEEATHIAHELGGYFFWMGIWSARPATDLQSDVSCLLSPEMFDEYLLPFIEEQTRWVERTVYHLDGPDAVRHLDSLLELPNLTAIQWIQGAGEKPTVEWIPLLKRIQDGGKLCSAYCEMHEVETLLRELRPEELLLVTTCPTEEEARSLIDKLDAWTVAT